MINHAASNIRYPLLHSLFSFSLLAFLSSQIAENKNTIY